LPYLTTIHIQPTPLAVLTYSFLHHSSIEHHSVFPSSFTSLILTHSPLLFAPLLSFSPSSTFLLIDTITMVRKPANRSPLPESNTSDNNSIDLTMPDFVEDYTETDIPPLVILPETLSPPSTSPPSPPPAPPSTLLSSSHYLRHHLHLTVTKANFQSSHRGHIPALFLQDVASPPLIVVHPLHIPVPGLPYVHVHEPNSVLVTTKRI
ncbi:hypothetical protein BKA57DRAFT_296475, partial [Linnemannia elongata]